MTNLLPRATNIDIGTEKQYYKTYSDLLLEYLESLGIEYVFGVPGGAIEPLFNALARSQRRGGIKVVVARHEAGAAFMADGYARETGKIGVCCSTTGPGATNLITGVASAYADSVPMLVITAQTPLPKFGKRALQDSSCSAIDIVGMFRHCTHYNSLISHVEQFESKLISALMSTQRTPKGPVHISIPADVLRNPCGHVPQIKPETIRQEFSMYDNHAKEQLFLELSKVKKIGLFIGDGCAGASENIMKFAELVQAPFVSGPMGKRWVNETHELYRGVYGFAGHQSAKALLDNPELELILVIGAQLGELSNSHWASPLASEKVIHIDASAEHFTRSTMARLHVCGNLNSIFESLINKVTEVKQWGRTWSAVEDSIRPNILGCYTHLENEDACWSNDTPIKAQRLFTDLANMLPQNVRVHIDAGNAWAWATHFFQRKEHLGYYRIAMGFGSMGWAIGSSIGAAMTKSYTPTLCITGDGSYLMSGQELTVAAQHNITLAMMVLNDSSLGMVKHGQLLGGAERIGHQLNAINFAGMAEAMGIEGIIIESPQDLAELDWTRIFSKRSPTLIDVRIDPNEVPPMGDRVKGLAEGSPSNASATPGG